MTDLLSLVDSPMCECLNADVAHPLRHALSEECRDDTNLVLKSDVDPGTLVGLERVLGTRTCAAANSVVAMVVLPELLVIVRFRALVRVSAISILAPSGKGPSSVRVRRAQARVLAAPV